MESWSLLRTLGDAGTGERPQSGVLQFCQDDAVRIGDGGTPVDSRTIVIYRQHIACCQRIRLDIPRDRQFSV
jgi:hypothetical protein